MSTRLAAPRSLLHHRDFMLLFGAESISVAGTQVGMVALPLVAILTMHAGAFEVGLLTAAQTSAFVLIGLPAGVWVDRMRRRPVLITADLARAALLFTIPVAFWLDALTLTQLYVVALGASIGTVFFEVASQSYLPTLVDRDQLVDGNGKLETTRAGAQVAGPSVGGWLVGLVTAPVAIVADAISYVGSAIFLSRIGAQETKRSRANRPGLLREIRDGLQYVFADRILRLIALRSAVANLSYSALIAVQALFLVSEVGLSPSGYGASLAAGAVGGLCGGALIGPLAKRLGSARIIWLGPVLFQPFALLIPLTDTGAKVGFFIVGSFFTSIGVVIYNVSQISFRQATTAEDMQGRMNATMRFLVWGTMPVGALLGGTLGEMYGVRVALWFGVLGLVLSIVPLLFSPLVRMRDLPASAS
ncbi:MFS transporter [Streptomyces spiramyceticus]|uniref:MFS transporter n=1 Tax=Streptomyces spiramyceticus TaxID=299717 RepID=UPI00237B4555|nr:MFS transporter [Streptomyces spiramyceticus]